MTDHDEILQLEQARTQAMLGKDAAVLEGLYDDDLVYIHSSGRVDTKASYLESIRSGRYNYRSIEFANVRVRRYGDTAIVSGDVVMEMSVRLDLRFTNVWARVGGSWKNVHWSSVKRSA